MTEGRVAGSRGYNVVVLFGSDKDGLGMRTSEGSYMLDVLERK